MDLCLDAAPFPVCYDPSPERIKDQRRVATASCVNSEFSLTLDVHMIHDIVFKPEPGSYISPKTSPRGAFLGLLLESP